MNLFIDTSSIVKLYHKEKGTDTLIEFIQERSRDLYITVSALTQVEFYSAVMKKVRSGELEKERTKEIFRLFKNDLKSMNVVEFNMNIIDISVSLLDNFGSEYSLKTLDSLQISSAMQGNDQFSIDYFIASDKNLMQLADKFFQTFNPG